MCFLFFTIALFVMMSIAVMVAVRVAVNDGTIEEHCQHLFHGKLGSASVDADA